MEIGKKKLALARRLVGRRDRVSSAARTGLKVQAVLHTHHHFFHHLRPLPYGDSSSLQCPPLIPLLHYPFLIVPLTLRLPTPCTASEKTSLNGKVLNCGRVWSAQGQHIFRVASNGTFQLGYKGAFLLRVYEGRTVIPIVESTLITGRCYD